MPDRWLQVCVSRLSPCASHLPFFVMLALPLVSQSLRSDARCCDAGSRACVSRLSPCFSQSLRSDARCCDAGSCASHLPFFVMLAPGSCLPLVSQSLRSVPDAVTLVPVCQIQVVSPACLSMFPACPFLRAIPDDPRKCFQEARKDERAKKVERVRGFSPFHATGS